VYAWWFDCNRQTDPVTDMDPVAFALESGNHDTQGDATSIDPIVNSKCENAKIMLGGHLYILRNGEVYDATGARIE